MFSVSCSPHYSFSLVQWRKAPWEKLNSGLKFFLEVHQERMGVALKGRWNITATCFDDENTPSFELEIIDEANISGNIIYNGQEYPINSNSKVSFYRIYLEVGTPEELVQSYEIKLPKLALVKSGKFEADGMCKLKSEDPDSFLPFLFRVLEYEAVKKN